MTTAEKMFWGAFAFIILAVVGAFVVYRMQNPILVTTGTSTTSAITATDWVRGTAGAKVSLIEYGDFQCPACAQYEPFVKQLMAEYGDRVQFSFRNFPLYQIHPNASIASQAAEAAGKQGKYWEMHDMLYEKQAEWSAAPRGQVVEKYFVGYAIALGLNLATFNSDLNSDAIKQKVTDDVALGNSASVNRTPTFFINLRQVASPKSYEELKAMIDTALAESSTQ